MPEDDAAKEEEELSAPARTIQATAYPCTNLLCDPFIPAGCVVDHRNDAIKPAAGTGHGAPAIVDHRNDAIKPAAGTGYGAPAVIAQSHCSRYH
jgi:hypothetical protein